MSAPPNAAAMAAIAAAGSAELAAEIAPRIDACPDPEAAASGLAALARHSRDAFVRLVRHPAALQALVGVFSHSRFLSNLVIREPECIEALVSSRDLSWPVSRADYITRAGKAAGRVAFAQLGARLAAFRRRQLLRILLRDIYAMASLGETTAELSHLADAVLEVAYERMRAEIWPPFREMAGEFSVLALGKLGGEELNYSSDIDLMFVFSPNEAADPQDSKEQFRRLGHGITSLLSSPAAGGPCYRVDLRLRPEGRNGDVVISVSAAQRYYQQRARDWELQMLIKARAAAGSAAPAEALLRFVEPLIYTTTLDFRAVESVAESRLRIHEKAAAIRQPGWDVKLAPGGIRDIEFLVQCLQRLHGGAEPWVRHGGTLLALSRLRDKDLISRSEYASLAAAYECFRMVEHRLQVEEDRQTHRLPATAAGLDLLAKRLRRPSFPIESGADLSRLLADHAARVEGIYRAVVLDSSRSDADSRLPPRTVPLEAEVYPAGKGCEDTLVAATDAARALSEALADSPWLIGELMRRPNLLATPAGAPVPQGPAARSYFQRRQFEILAASLTGPVPIFDTLEQLSALAAELIQAAFEEAVSLAEESLGVTHREAPRMMVIALGRLGVLEFDLGSDADLVFVLPDAAERFLPFWAKAAENLIQWLGAYTGDGTLFAVDSRLRPRGRDGNLVQLERHYLDYFARAAEAWEGIAYMKARAVAGDTERGTSFLGRLQQADWQRYGQGGRSRADLRRMRARLERELGAGSPLKAGLGGYYDIDFALLYLRLTGADVFYPALNTPSRIRIVAGMGQVSAADAAFLLRSATLFRAIDHSLRLQSGQPGAQLPAAPARLDQLDRMVRRWLPGQSAAVQSPESDWRGLRVELAEVQSRTREYFDRVFHV
jgi:glutamate-ammonia-ligase adenylyltransferase